MAIQVVLSKRQLKWITKYHPRYKGKSLKEFAKERPRAALTWIEGRVKPSDVRLDVIPTGDKNENPFELIRRRGGEVQVYCKNSLPRRLWPSVNPDDFVFTFTVSPK